MFKKLNKAFLFVVFAFSIIKAQDVSIAVGDTAFAGYTDDIVVPIQYLIQMVMLVEFSLMFQYRLLW